MHRKSISGEYMRFPNQNQIICNARGLHYYGPFQLQECQIWSVGEALRPPSPLPPYHVYWQCKVLYISPHPETAVQKAADMTDISVLSF